LDSGEGEPGTNRLAARTGNRPARDGLGIAATHMPFASVRPAENESDKASEYRSLRLAASGLHQLKNAPPARQGAIATDECKSPSVPLIQRITFFYKNSVFKKKQVIKGTLPLTTICPEP
jgi:hypothetical protein